MFNTNLAFSTLGGWTKCWCKWSTHSTTLLSVVPVRLMKSQVWRWATMLHSPTPPACGHTGIPYIRINSLNIHNLVRIYPFSYQFGCHQVDWQHLIKTSHSCWINLKWSWTIWNVCFYLKHKTPSLNIS